MLKELIEKYTNEDGTIDYEGIENENNQNIGKIVAKERNKIKNKQTSNTNIDNSVNDNEEQQKQQESTIPQELMDTIQSLQNEVNDLRGNSKVQQFKSKAKEFNVDENVVNTFVESGADLDKVDLEQFRRDVVDNNISNDQEDEETKIKNEEDQIRELMGL